MLMKDAVSTCGPDQIGSRASASTAPMYADLTRQTGKDEWIYFMRGYLVRAGLLPDEDEEEHTMDGPTRGELSDKAGHQLSFSNALRDSSKSTIGSGKTCTQTDTVFHDRSSPMLPAWVRRILANDIGLLATPTTKANQCAASMQKWPSCRRLTLVFGGRLTPEIYEWMMGWPIGFTASRRWGMGKSRSKPQPPTSCSAVR